MGIYHVKSKWDETTRKLIWFVMRGGTIITHRGSESQAQRACEMLTQVFDAYKEVIKK